MKDMRSGASAHLWIVALALAAAVSRAAAADDQQECLKGSKETAVATIAACTRAIESGDYSDRSLSKLYHQRGYSWSWTNDADRVDRAFKDYTEAIRIDPKAADSLLNRSHIYNQRHDYDRAIADANQAFEGGLSHYGKQVGYGERGYAYQAKGDNDRAIADYTSSIQLDANNKATLITRGNAYWAKGDLDRAIADYDQAIALDPKYALAYYNRATAYRVKGDLDRAIADSSRAIALYPRYRDAYYNRAYAYQAKGDLQRAIADYDQMIALDPNDNDAHSNRAKAYWSKGDFRHAIADSDPGQVSSWLATAVFLAAAAWLCRRLGMQARGRFSGRTMVEICEQEVAEMQRKNAALEKIAVALEKRSLG
ncbi:tetratricopeptide repeat protein [uncultured Bradyrhizobium sp.]|uniref:tetratricopeptide repeat protein n=1 Tax=Bradyrhizobium sp. TaxID=376 RepID=UPI002612ACD1|nr:tetratricopeptide repeat protein [uncultured Bradyrhizobium sp.]